MNRRLRRAARAKEGDPRLAVLRSAHALVVAMEETLRLACGELETQQDEHIRTNVASFALYNTRRRAQQILHETAGAP